MALKRISICQLLLMLIVVPVIAWFFVVLIILTLDSSSKDHRDFMESVPPWKPLELDFNGRVMRIPPDYIQMAIYKTQPITDRHTSELIMKVRWPDFVPRSILGISEVAKVNSWIKIRMNAPSVPPEHNDTSQFQRPVKQSNLQRILSLSQWNTEQLDEIGLVKYVRISSNENSGRGGWLAIIYVPMDAAYKTPTGEGFYFDCTERYDHIEEQHQEGIPSECKIKYRLKNQVALTYLFNPQYLNDWRELDQGIRHLMKTFTGNEQ